MANAHRQRAVTAGPVRATQPRIGEADPGAQHDDAEGEHRGQGQKAAIPGRGGRSVCHRLWSVRLPGRCDAAGPRAARKRRHEAGNRVGNRADSGGRAERVPCPGDGANCTACKPRSQARRRCTCAVQQRSGSQSRHWIDRAPAPDRKAKQVVWHTGEVPYNARLARQGTGRNASRMPWQGTTVSGDTTRRAATTEQTSEC